MEYLAFAIIAAAAVAVALRIRSTLRGKGCSCDGCSECGCDSGQCRR